MKLLLTSSGLSKRDIGAALQGMFDESPSEVRVGFIPTAANVEPYNKDWVVSQFAQLQRYGFYQIDIVDIAADGVDWRTRLDACDMLWLSGAIRSICLIRRARRDSIHGSEKILDILKHEIKKKIPKVQPFYLKRRCMLVGARVRFW